MPQCRHRRFTASVRYYVLGLFRERPEAIALPGGIDGGDLCLALRGPGRKPRHRDEIDAIPVPVRIWQIVAQVRAVNAHCLPVLEHSHAVRQNLCVAERGPSMAHGLVDKVLPASAHRRPEQRLACHRVVEGDGTCRFLRQKARLLPVTGPLSPVPVEAADSISRLDVAAPALGD